MANTSDNLAPAPPQLQLTESQIKEAALRLDAKKTEEALMTKAQGSPLPVVQPLSQAQAKAQDEVEALLSDTEDEFKDQVTAEVQAARALKYDEKIQQLHGSKSIKDLTEEDAYNLNIGIAAAANASPDFLKVVMKDSNYIARWVNTNSIRLSQCVAKGFKFILQDEVVNLDTLEMFLDSQKHFVWADLVAVKIPKNIYYAGLRAAYLKSLHATNNKKAAEAGAAFAKQNLAGSLGGAERTYLAQQEQQGTSKPIYNPAIGV